MLNLTTHFFIFLRGLAMGSADVIPGVSGGTIAFITGIYDKLIMSLNSMDYTALKLFFSGKWKSLAEHINLSFLVVLFSGIIIAIVSLAKVITWLLHNYEEALWAFFFGLILASAWMIIRQVKAHTVRSVAVMVAGIAIAFLIVSLSLVRTPDTLPYIFMSGFIAIIAMILPGVSGSFILVILDKYQFIIGIVAELSGGVKKLISAMANGDFNQLGKVLHEMQALTLAVFALGCVLGLISFAKALTWLFRRFRDITMSFLTGFMIGSLWKVWPWKQTTEWYTDRHGELKPLAQANVFPEEYGLYFIIVVVAAIAGFVIVYLFDWLAHVKEKR